MLVRESPRGPGACYGTRPKGWKKASVVLALSNPDKATRVR